MGCADRFRRPRSFLDLAKNGLTSDLMGGLRMPYVNLVNLIQKIVVFQLKFNNFTASETVHRLIQGSFSVRF
jgi:hypothetical protein